MTLPYGKVRNPDMRTRTGQLVGQLLLALSAIGVACGCVAAQAHADPSAQHDSDSRACGAFTVIKSLVDESQHPDPAPGGQLPPRTYDFVGLANALNMTQRSSVSEELNASLTTYVYALAEVGAALNHREPVDNSALDSATEDLTRRCDQPPS